MKRLLCTFIFMAVAIGSFGQTKRMAVTCLSENMMRLKPDYESPLETMSLMGTVVEIIGEEGYWRQVVTPEPYTAWCTDLGLVEMSEEEIQAYKEAAKYICIRHHSGVYAKPSENSRRLSDLSIGNLVRIVYKNPEAAEVKKVKASKKGKWVEVMLPDGRKGWVPAADVTAFAPWAVKQKPTAERIVSTAMQFEGTPYLWGGASSKGLDCSGLVRLTWFMNGYLLPRNASQQVKYGREIIMVCDHKVAAGSEALHQEMIRRTAHLQPGDLVFFGTPETLWAKEKITHVGIYIGEGKIIHASHKVRVNSLIPGQPDFYENSHKLLKARRFIDYQGPGLVPVIESPHYFRWGE